MFTIELRALKPQDAKSLATISLSYSLETNLSVEAKVELINKKKDLLIKLEES